MQFKSLFLGAVATSGALAADRLCGFKEPSAEDIAIAQTFAAQEAESLAAANETMSIQATTTVNVYFHVIATSQSASGGYISVSHTLFADSLVHSLLVTTKKKTEMGTNMKKTLYRPPACLSSSTP